MKVAIIKNTMIGAGYGQIIDFMTGEQVYGSFEVFQTSACLEKLINSICNNGFSDTVIIKDGIAYKARWQSLSNLNADVNSIMTESEIDAFIEIMK
jgi:hypothetical protein